MAKKRHTSTAIVRAIPVRAPAPIIKVAAPRAAPKQKKHHKRRHHGGGNSTSAIISIGIGGAIVGFIEHQFGANLPTIPLLGRKGTLAIGLHYFSKGRGGLIRDAAVAAAAIAGYELGGTGKITGDDVVGSGVVPQVSGHHHHHVRGIAAQV